MACTRYEDMYTFWCFIDTTEGGCPSGTQPLGKETSGIHLPKEEARQEPSHLT